MNEPITPKDRFEAWLQSPEMKRAEAAFRAMDEFWAAAREQGTRKRLAFVAYAERVRMEAKQK